MTKTKTPTDLLTELRAVLGIEYPKQLPETFYYDPYYADLLTDSYFQEVSYYELITRSFTAGFLLGVLTESSQDYARIHEQMLLQSNCGYCNVVSLLVGRNQTKVTEVLKNASDLAFQEYTCLTHQPERWQDEPLDKTMKEIILFFQLGFEKGIYNLFD